MRRPRYVSLAISCHHDPGRILLRGADIWWCFMGGFKTMVDADGHYPVLPKN
jgi:hypothetical protein